MNQTPSTDGNDRLLAHSISSNSDEETTRKRRKKITKACAFCRKRRIKCDKTKPMCVQCVSRGLNECVYVDGLNNKNGGDDSSMLAANKDLILKISHLEEKLKKYESSPDSVGDESSKSCDGPTDDTYHLIRMLKSKPNYKPKLRYLSVNDGVSTVFGASSWRTIVECSNEIFSTEYTKIMERIKPEKKKWKIQHNITTIPSEIRCLTDPTNSQNNSSYLDMVCDNLPTHDVLFKCMDEFFQSELHDLLGFLDEQKVKKDFEDCIVSIEPETNKVKLQPSDGKNFFKIGIVVLITYFAYYKDHVPDVIDNFVATLTGISSTKMNYLERAQFLLLRFVSKTFILLDYPDGAMNSDLISELCSVVITLGITDLDWWYSQQEASIVGPKHTIKRLWYWTLYCDVVVSFDIGKPLSITDDHFDVKTLIDIEDNDKETSKNEKEAFSVNLDRATMCLRSRRETLLKKFLVVARYCICKITTRKEIPEIRLMIQKIIEFAESNFLPLKCYTDPDMLCVVDKFDLALLCTTLGMLVNLHSVWNFYIRKCSAEVEAGGTKYSIAALTICINIIIMTYKEYKFYSEKCGSARTSQIIFKPSEPNLNMALFFTQSLLMRTLAETYSHFFFKVAHVDDSRFFGNGKEETYSDPLTTIKLDNDTLHSFMTIVKKFNSVIDRLFDPALTDLPKLIAKSYFLTTSLALERVSRALLDKAIASRKETENIYNIETMDLDKVSQELLDQITNDVWSKYELQSQSVWSSALPGFYTDLTALSAEQGQPDTKWKN